MDKIEGIRNRLDVQKVQNEWFDFKKVQAEEQVKLITTVQSKIADVKAELRKQEQQQLPSFQDSRKPLQDVMDDAVSSFQKLLEFSALSDSSSNPIQAHLDVESIITSLKNQFQLQTFTGKEFEKLLSLLKQNPDNGLIKNAIADVLRAFSAIQLANEAQISMGNAIDDLIVLLKNDVTLQLQKDKKLNYKTDAKILNLLSNSTSIHTRQNQYQAFPDLKNLLHQIQQSFAEESSISKTIGRIFSAMKRLDDAQNFDLRGAVEKLLNLTGISLNETQDKLSLLFQKVIGYGDNEEKGMKRVAQIDHSAEFTQKLQEKAMIPPEKNELEDALYVINQLKKEYPQSQAVQTFSTQTLNGLTANLLASQPMLHFFLKSFLNDSPHIADVWIDPNHEEDGGKSVKIMLSVDLENSERFEVELKLGGKMLSANVYCPESYVNEMQGIRKVIREQANDLGYSVPNLNVGVLLEKKSLEEIFSKESSGRRSFHARV